MAQRVRIPFDSLNLYAVLQECQRLVGGKIRHIGQPRPLDLVLTIYAQRAEHRLLLSADPQFARLHLCTIRQPNPPTPPPFCMTLRKHLEGGSIRSLRQIGFDRIIRLEVEGADGLTYHLIAELMGKHSNLILTTASGTILSAIKWVPPSKSRARPILPHQPYQLPPTRREGLLHPLMVSREEVEEKYKRVGEWESRRVGEDRGERAKAKGESPESGTQDSTINHQPSTIKPQTSWLTEHFEGLSTFTATELALRCQRAGVDGFLEWQQVVLNGKWQPVFVRMGEEGSGRTGEEKPETRNQTPNPQPPTPIGAYPFHVLQLPDSWQHPRDSISLAWEHYFNEASPRAQAEAMRTTLLTNLQRALQARRDALEDIQHALSQSAQVQKWQLYGELILAFGQHLTPGSAELQAPDYNQPDAPLVNIPLDPEKTPVENAEAYFARARHAREAQGGLQARQQRLEAEVVQIEALLNRLESTDHRPEALQTLLEEANKQGWLRQPVPTETPKRPEKDLFEGHKIRQYTSEEGYQVLVGENSEANDFLTVRVARPNDWWLHVRTGTGAHVLIRTENHPERVPKRTLEFAARLAARHSTDRHAGVVAVDYTLRKYVRKPRGAPPGLALYTHEKTLYVRPSDK